MFSGDGAEVISNVALENGIRLKKCSEEDNGNNSSALCRKELSPIFKLVLRFMKIGGQCYEDLFLDEFALLRGIFSRIYCAVVVVGQ